MTWCVRYVVSQTRETPAPRRQPAQYGEESAQGPRHLGAPDLHGHDGLLLPIHAPADSAAHEHAQIRSRCKEESFVLRTKTESEIKTIRMIDIQQRRSCHPQQKRRLQMQIPAVSSNHFHPLIC